MNSIRVLKAVDRGNVRMIQRGQDLSLALEPGQPLSILGELLRQDLDGNFALQSGVLGSVHLSHPALTDLLSDLVMGDGLAYQRASRLLGSLCGNTRSLTLEGQSQRTANMEIGGRSSIRLVLETSILVLLS